MARTAVFLSTLLLVGGTARAKRRRQRTPAELDAKAINKQALQYARADRPREALAHFRAAHKRAPHMLSIANNLGVSEMRLGYYALAKARFDRIVAQKSNHVDARDNLKDLEPFMTKAEWKGEMQSHTTEKFPRITPAELASGSAKTRAFREGRKPFVLTHAMDDLAAGRAWDIDALVSEFGGERVDFYPHNMAKENVKPYFASLADAVAALRAPVVGSYPINEGHPGTYIQWNVGFDVWHKLVRGIFPKVPTFQRDEEWLLGCFNASAAEGIDPFGFEPYGSGADAPPFRAIDHSIRSQFQKGAHWRMMLIGDMGSGMFNHKDILRTSSWQAQLAGSKRWHLCGPDSDRFMYGAGDVDAFAPNYKSFPLFERAACIDDRVVTGEMLFYPKDYWHQTINVVDDPRRSAELSISITCASAAPAALRARRRRAWQTQRAHAPTAISPPLAHSPLNTRAQRRSSTRRTSRLCSPSWSASASSRSGSAFTWRRRRARRCGAASFRCGPRGSAARDAPERSWASSASRARRRATSRFHTAWSE